MMKPIVKSVRPKHELEHVLEAVVDGMDDDIEQVKAELARLDPSAVAMARLKFARIEGTLNFLKKRLEEYQSE